MHYKRVIPCLDVDAGRVVKGVEFVDIRDAGDPVELAAHYDREGADELVFLDITATHEKRETIAAARARAPPTRCSSRSRSAAASARSEDAQAVLDAGADKVSVNSAALQRPELIDELARACSARSASCSRSTPRRAPPDGGGDRRTAGRPTWRAGAPRPAATCVGVGARGASSAARGRSC